MEAVAKQRLITTSDKVKAIVNKGMKKSSIALMLEISRPTFYARLKDNSWSTKEINLLRENGII